MRPGMGGQWFPGLREYADALSGRGCWRRNAAARDEGVWAGRRLPTDGQLEEHKAVRSTLASTALPW